MDGTLFDSEKLCDIAIFALAGSYGAAVPDETDPAMVAQVGQCLCRATVSLAGPGETASKR